MKKQVDNWDGEDATAGDADKGGRISWETEWSMDFKKRSGRGTEELIPNMQKIKIVERSLFVKLIWKWPLHVYRPQ
jgi:hypothetical protein